MFGGKKKPDPRVQAILEAEGIKYEVDREGDYRILCGFENDRSQFVLINSNTETFAGVEVREVWSPALKGSGQLSAAVANDLLARNARYKVGAWQIVQNNDRVLASFKVVLSADADRSELVPVIRMVAIQADEVEKEFLQTDEL